MTTDLTIGNVADYYAKIKRQALNQYGRGDFNACIHTMDTAALFAQITNRIYVDYELEQLMGDISKKLLSQHIDDYHSVENRFVFYDQIGSSTVLGLQYVRALISWNVEFLYVLDKGIHTKPEQILEEVQTYSKASVIILDDEDSLVRIQQAYRAIVNYRPQKAFLHAPAEGAVGVILWNALAQITRYRIVPGDHHFYIGVSVTDYAIEFRNVGIKIALEKRGFRPEQILKQSYYPIVVKTAFQGFPEEVTADKVVMFSGGAYYKTYGKNDVYFKLLERLLNENPKLVILIAGTGADLPYRKFIKKHGFQKRLILLGYRKDLSALLTKIDIYLGTYPFVGGLMSQYAAVSAKPILQYATDEIAINSLEGIIGGEENSPVECADMNQFFSYAKQLIEDKSFREQRGVEMSTRIITVAQFNSNLKELIMSNTYSIDVSKLPIINYQAILDLYLDVANRYTYALDSVLLSRYSVFAPLYFPKMFLRFLFNAFLWNKVIAKLKR
ncbi:MAG: hypothetical protein RRZ83_05750 [Alistipes sp.]